MAFRVMGLGSKEVGNEHFVDRPMGPAPTGGQLPMSPVEKVFVLVASLLFAVISIGSIRN